MVLHGNCAERPVQIFLGLLQLLRVIDKQKGGAGRVEFRRSLRKYLVNVAQEKSLAVLASSHTLGLEFNEGLGLDV